MQRQPAAFSPRLGNVRMQVCSMWLVQTDKSIVYFLVSFLFRANAKLNTFHLISISLFFFPSNCYFSFFYSLYFYFFIIYHIQLDVRKNEYLFVLLKYLFLIDETNYLILLKNNFIK